MAKHTRKVNAPLPPAFKFAEMAAPSIIIHGKDDNKILEIEGDGNVIWHAEDQASEAAEVFCRDLHFGIEHKAGIRQARKDWEHERFLEIKKLLESGELTTDTLAKVFKKNEFMRKLAGDRTDDE